ncbi:MBL fold metallo-hydrolase [Allonocardiopsis opalescens]|uniref:Glyoxylase-like metal-dependent hydrolase (Beta-lactamase superfamily II) n=1 Tax=Allonocardiopsis opalescens TaxID=1144618 RepID=A0A2T0QDJ6_9ACTN|nr:MBL fold metallo-hydrolase [Allonocardiopsis opalescens]PRY01978.1 glyoxylase-like metal-dependent hydrolase (beta-lactamase superfamily II) [Allonocardiopsis opalescens]
MFWKKKAKQESASGDGSPEGAPADVDTNSVAKAKDEVDGASTPERPADAIDADNVADAEAVSDGGSDEAEAASDDGIRLVESTGTLTVDDVEHAAVSNSWIFPVSDDEVIVVDPAFDGDALVKAVGGREVVLVLCTSGVRDHIAGALAVAEADEAPIALHKKELRLWRREHGAEQVPDLELEDGGTLEVGDVTIEVLATPGSSPGAVSFYVPERGVVFTGDTLVKGRPGPVGDGYRDFTGQLASIGETLLALPADTRVLPAHGEETTIAAEAANFDDWVTPED